MALAARTVCYAECDVCGNEEEVTATDYIAEMEDRGWLHIWGKLYCWDCKPQKHTALTATQMREKLLFDAMAGRAKEYYKRIYEDQKANGLFWSSHAWTK
jgi:hypothetical protein